jgi:hypothetical protein
MKWVLILIVSMLWVGAANQSCKQPGVPNPPPVILPTPMPTPAMDVYAYLAQSKMLDGNTATPQRESDALFFRRQDFGSYQISDSLLADDGSYAITTWSHSPFGPFVAANGDGGEQYIVEGSTVRIAATQDGGKPGVQWLNGPQCGGTGWVLFRADATRDWKSLVAQLNDVSTPTECSLDKLSPSYTRYRIADVTFPILGTIEAVISEHYDAATIADSTAMERFFMAKGWGRLVWQSWGRAPARIDLSARCLDFGWNSLEGWQLNDCREAVNVIKTNGSLTGKDEWHP